MNKEMYKKEIDSAFEILSKFPNPSWYRILSVVESLKTESLRSEQELAKTVYMTGKPIIVPKPEN